MSVNEKRLKNLLLVLSAYIWYKVYFFVLEWLCTNILKLSIEVLSIVETVLIVLFVLFLVPVTLGIRHLFLKFLEQ